MTQHFRLLKSFQWEIHLVTSSVVSRTGNATSWMTEHASRQHLGLFVSVHMQQQQGRVFCVM